MHNNTTHNTTKQPEQQQQRKEKTNVVQYNQTYIKNYLYIRRRDFDGKWEVVKLIDDPRYVNDTEWQGPRGPNGTPIKQQIWVTVQVCASRDQAIVEADKFVNDTKTPVSKPSLSS